MKHEEYFIIAGLFLFGFWLWTLPIQANPMPFGEGDSAWQFGNSDAILQQGKTYTRLPGYVGDLWYPGINHILGSNALQYPPPYQVNAAIFGLIGNQRVVPIFIFYAIASFLGALSVYFLLRKLYGFLPAVISSLGILLFFRTIMVYLWGQRPSITAFAFTPLVLYCLYKYFTGIYKEEKKVIFLYLGALLACGQYLVHIIATVQMIIMFIFVMVLFLIKYRKLPFIREHIKHYLIILLIIAVIALPFAPIFLGATKSSVAFANPTYQWNRLMSWFDVKNAPNFPNPGGPPLIFYCNTKDEVLVEGYNICSNYNYFFGYGLLVVLGIAYLLFKREDRDLIMLAWLFGTYASVHLDIMGIFPFHYAARMLISEYLIFYSLIVIGIFGFIGLIKEVRIKAILKVAASIIFIILLFFQYNQAHTILKDAYNSPVIRITQAQYDMAEWIDKNTDTDAQVYAIGEYSYPKNRFMSVISKRYIHWQEDPFLNFTQPDYVLVDYSDVISANDAQGYGFLQAWEINLLNNSQIIYVPSTTKIQMVYQLNYTPHIIYRDDKFTFIKVSP